MFLFLQLKIKRVWEAPTYNGGGVPPLKKRIEGKKEKIRVSFSTTVKEIIL